MSPTKPRGHEFYRQLDRYLGWTWKLPYYLFRMAVYLPGRAVASITKEIDQQGFHVWISNYIQFWQLVVVIVNAAFALLYLLTTVVPTLKYFGVAHLIYIVMHSVAAGILVFTEWGMEYETHPRTRRPIMTYDNGVFANNCAMAELYTVLVCNTLLVFLILIWDLAKFGFAQTYSDPGELIQYHFVGLTCGSIMFITTISLIATLDLRTYVQTICVVAAPKQA